MITSFSSYSKFLHKPRLLVVDDEEINLLVFNELFGTDYDLFSTDSGEQAIHLAHEINPDLILLDIMLPEMNGYDVCSQLKSESDTQHIPIIFISSLDDAGDEIHGFNLGAVDFIHKPINPVVTRARVYTHTLLKQQTDQLKNIAAIDAGTGIANRRRFEEHLQMVWSNAIREKQFLSLILMDIDHFKYFNDTYGHLQGDHCLYKVAQAITSCINRPQDLAARYGGEEFVAILPNTTHDGAVHLALDILQKTRDLAVPHAQSIHKIVTLSAGIATLAPTAEEKKENLILLADQALYRAKENGRNRYFSSDNIYTLN